MQYRAILFDLDNTLLDFLASSYIAMTETFSRFGKPSFSQEEFREYAAVNERLWEQFERGEIEKETIFTERFRIYFSRIGFACAPADFNTHYLRQLALGTAKMPHCDELLQTLHGSYRLFAVTNGDTYAQESRLRRSGLDRYFDGIFISEQLGSKKPEKTFFDRVFALIGEEYRACSMIVGDSLSSDMQGGRNAGITTCYFGRRENADDRCDYVIEDLLELPPLLQTLAEKDSPTAPKG